MTQYLYKYGSITGRSETVFSTPTLWLASPATLNDPFECRPWLTFEGSRDEIVESLARGIRAQNPMIPPFEANAHAVSIWLEGRHRDPKTWENFRADLTSKFAHGIGLYCLSETCENILMWSHYAAQHQGYCLQFEWKETAPFFGYAQQVKYAEEFPIVDVYKTSPEKQLDLIFLTKYVGWDYEREWRIIDHDTGPGLRQYAAELLTGVVFGLRMSDEHKAQIRNWTSSRGHPVRFYQAVQDSRKFAINIEELS
jgi:hypothetical protein